MLCLDLCLVGERYDAGGGDDPRAHEWPPHPARVFAALRSVAERSELDALRVLERLPPPTVLAAPLVSVSRSRGYVVTNARDPQGKHQVHPGRTSGWRERSSLFPADPRVRFIWRGDAGLSGEVVAGLDDLARRVPYLGRSTCPAIMAFRQVAEDQPSPTLETIEPTSHDEAEFYLRTPYPGYTDELEALYELGQPAWQASSTARQPYRRVTGEPASPPSPVVVASAYSDLVILRFVDARPSGNLVALFTAALRSKVMSQTEDPLPPALHGHGLDGQPHVAYLGLPFVGAQHADGHLLGLAVAIPGLEAAERRRILRGILGTDPDRVIELEVPALGRSFTMRHLPNDPRPVGATPHRWIRPARTWVSATPLILDRYPKKPDQFTAAVARSIEQSGLPRPVAIQMGTAPLTTGAVRLTPAELPRKARGRLFRHVRVTFEHPVKGPVLAGAGRYFGVGLFAPEDEEGER